jgi:hypothetical protein
MTRSATRTSGIRIEGYIPEVTGTPCAIVVMALTPRQDTPKYYFQTRLEKPRRANMKRTFTMTPAVIGPEERKGIEAIIAQ